MRVGGRSARPHVICHSTVVYLHGIGRQALLVRRAAGRHGRGQRRGFGAASAAAAAAAACAAGAAAAGCRRGRAAGGYAADRNFVILFDVDDGIVLVVRVAVGRRDGACTQQTKQPTGGE